MHPSERSGNQTGSALLVVGSHLECPYIGAVVPVENRVVGQIYAGSSQFDDGIFRVKIGGTGLGGSGILIADNIAL